MRLGSQNTRRWRSRTREPQGHGLVISRFWILRFLIVLLFGVLVAQLVRMQITQHDSYQARAENNRLRTVPILPSRGLIYDRNGVQLVKNEPIFSAAIVPHDVAEEDLLTIAAEVSAATGVPPQEIATRVDAARKSKDPFTPIIVKSNLDDETAFKLRERQATLPGLQVVVESVRDYPETSLVSHILGFVGRIDEQEYGELRDDGYGMNDRLGKAGVEYTYEDVLRGTAGYRIAEIDAAGQEVSAERTSNPRPAGNLVLSIDLDLQRQVTEYVRRGMGSSTNASAIVMDVHTGEVLAMVTLPSYDNNILTDPVDQDRLDGLLNDPTKPMLNHAISEVNPPGSTFKLVTGTAALQEGVATPDTTVTSYGSITVEDEYTEDRVWIMRDWAALGTMNFYRGLAMSSDVYFYYMSGGYFQNGVEVFHGLGATRLAEYARQYGFGASTGVDLPGEAIGNVPDPEWKEKEIGEVWTLGDTYNFGIGQGYLTVTPLQLVRVTAAIANGGDLLEPHVVKSVVDQQGNVVRNIEPEVANKLPISSDNFAIMREAMHQAVIYGPARTGASSQVSIAAKTGTAEFGQQSADGRYATSHGWYTGYAPLENPEIAVVVFLEKGVGATNAGPVAKSIFDYYFGRQNQAQGQP